MDYQATLKEARAEIEAVLRRHDIVGHFVLCAPGFAEVSLVLGASWSKLQLEATPDGGAGIRLRSKAEEYGGDKERQRRELEASVGVPGIMWPLLASAALAMQEVSEQFDAATGAEHTPIRRTEEH